MVRLRDLGEFGRVFLRIEVIVLVMVNRIATI